MEKYITDERTGLRYELAGDYYYLAGDDEPEEHRPIGIWGCGCPADERTVWRNQGRSIANPYQVNCPSFE